MSYQLFFISAANKTNLILTSQYWAVAMFIAARAAFNPHSPGDFEPRHSSAPMKKAQKATMVHVLWVFQ